MQLTSGAVEQPPLPVAHSSTSLAQSVPVQPEGHAQLYVDGPVGVQLPPFWQGLVGLQASIGVSQLTPCHPAEQEQLYVPGPVSVQVPFVHGFEAQATTTVWQFVPVKPPAQLQL